MIFALQVHFAGHRKAYIIMKYYLAPMVGLTTYHFRTNRNRCYGNSH